MKKWYSQLNLFFIITQITICAKNDLIVGYRLSPEEIHGEEIGYLLDDSLYLINEVIRLGIDYIHTSFEEIEPMLAKPI